MDAEQLEAWQKVDIEWCVLCYCFRKVSAEMPSCQPLLTLVMLVALKTFYPSDQI